MKRSYTVILSALAIFGVGPTFAQSDGLSSISIGTASTAGGTANGVAVVTERVGTPTNQPGTIGDNLAGLQYVPGQIPLDGAPASVAFYTLTGLNTPGGASNPASSFMSYATLTAPTGVVNYLDVASKLTATSYSGLTFAEADLGFGARDFYTIHHRSGTDYLAQIVPGTGVSSQVRDLKPMSWVGPTAGGPADTGASGYFGLAWATGILTAGAPYADQSLYYLRTDPSAPGHTFFGVMIPALTGASADTLNLNTAVGSYGVGGYTTLAFSPSAVGNYGANQFYYLRQDTGPGGTGNTILGRLNPSLVSGVRTISDIANLGGVFTTLNFAADATGPAGAWGSSQFYATGALVSGGQSISFEAIPDHDVGDTFTVTPTASSGLDIDVTVVSGPATIQTTGISGAIPLSQRIFTVTTTGPGIVTLQATQAGRTLPLPAYATNMLQQNFWVRGLPTITSPSSAPATVGAAFTYTITASGSPTSFTASPLPAGLVLNATTGVISGTPTTAATTIVTMTATNPTGTSSATTLTVTVAAAGTVPVVTSSNVASGTVGAAFSYAITAAGSPTSFTASPLPAGLVLNTTTGAITGTPSAPATTITSLTATNATGTSQPSTVTITIAAAGVAPEITSASSAPGTVGTTFATYTIVASGTPTSYNATGLPAGLAINTVSGTITGTPTTAGTFAATLSATNSTGTGTAPLTITVAAANAAPVITSSTSAAGTTGTPFATYQITATGSPTSFAASPLPAGLVLDTATGAITGTPNAPGTTITSLTATNSTGTSQPSTVTITIAAAGVAPEITSANSAPGTVGVVFTTYTIVASGSPTSFNATGLPAGLVVNTVSGKITGTATAAGTFPVTLSATNGTGTGTAPLTITVAAANAAPVITSSTSAAGTTGTPFATYQITATGSPTSYTASPLPAGLVLNTTSGAITGTPSTAGSTMTSLRATNSTGTSQSSTVTITIAAAGTAPTITSANSAPGTVGAAFTTYTIVASGSPTSFNATGLPAGLAVNTVSGKITGTPTTAGTSAVTMSATNGTGTGTAPLTITVSAADVPPVITGPTSTTGTVGTPFVTYLIAATGLPTSFTATGLPPGLTLDALTGAINGTPSTAGVSVVTLTAANASGVTSASLTITVAAASVAPVITSPTTAPGTAGTPFDTYVIGGSGLPTSYTATGLPPGLSVNPTTGAITGTPTGPGTWFVTISATNAQGTSTAGLTITIAASAQSRIVNFSARAVSGPGDQTLIVGFVIAGDGKNLLVRGIGPTLSTLGVANPLADPVLTLRGRTEVLATNDDWQITSAGQATASQIAATSAQVGAFSLANGSKDSALIFTVNNGVHTTSMVGPNSTTGVALTEIYDIDTTTGARLINVSARMNVTAGEGTLIAGLVISGNNPKRVLIRGVGPTLSSFAVAGVLPDPKITVFSRGIEIASNDDWGTGTSSAEAIMAAAVQVGAFALPAGSKDASLLITLQPGAYTVHVNGAGSTTGVALVEVYDTE